ncbi:MAG: TIGR03936 family radical SAM-associated protein [Defluviitaleaceae bacterium]|nr:TIGR03936 family radical SAM-associated protein [Defluviitaleaceae bacterium]
MYRMRLRFSKGGALRFIGHLDFLRVFQQTIRRAGLPAAYSQGFHPHLLLSFALPLPLGMESVNDYADLILEEELPGEEIADRLTAHAPEGLVIKAAYPAENKAASVVTLAEYEIDIRPYTSPDEFGGYSYLAPPEIEQAVDKIKKSESIIISKKTKSGIRETDIKPDIAHIEASSRRIYTRLAAGSSRFLHPMIVAELVLGEKPNPALLCRTDLFNL